MGPMDEAEDAAMPKYDVVVTQRTRVTLAAQDEDDACAKAIELVSSPGTLIDDATMPVEEMPTATARLATGE